VPELLLRCDSTGFLVLAPCSCLSKALTPWLCSLVPKLPLIFSDRMAGTPPQNLGVPAPILILVPSALLFSRVVSPLLVSGHGPPVSLVFNFFGVFAIVSVLHPCPPVFFVLIR